MKNAFVLVTAVLCGARLVAAEPLKPDTFLTTYGVYQRTDGSDVTELTIRTNELRLTASDVLQHHTLAGTTNWRAGHHWFVYVAKDMRAWAYNGDQGLWLLTARPLESRVVPITDLQERPPAVVLKRLPKAVRKLLPSSQQAQPNSGAPNGS